LETSIQAFVSSPIETYPLVPRLCAKQRWCWREPSSDFAGAVWLGALWVWWAWCVMSDATSWHSLLTCCDIWRLVVAGSHASRPTLPTNCKVQRRVCKIPTDQVNTPPVMLLTVHTSQAVGRSLLGFDKNRVQSGFKLSFTFNFNPWDLPEIIEDRLIIFW
jgi:hypothetical protein